MVRVGFVGGVIFFAFFGIDGGGAQDIVCSGNTSAIADGLCDPSNNNFECGYDGGDCCECTCSMNSTYPCGFDGFDCRNPFVNDIESECLDTNSSAPPCSMGYAIQDLLVNDTKSARLLAETVNCTGGNFNVTWEGWITIDRTIYVAEGTTIYLTGADSNSEVDGGGSVRLFTLANASFHVNGMSLSNGNASYGGAIAAITSNITLNNATFKTNFASNVGGALYMDRSLLASLDGQAIFTGNSAGSRCGALVASRGSIASWSGQTSFSSNSAINGGGAVCVNNESIVSWSDTTSFTSNSVDISSGIGGALVVDNVSHVAWSAETFFVNNSGGWGSAMYVKDGSSVSWSAETSFISNTGRFGGTVVILGNSNASWEAETRFINNNVFAGSGGALYIRDASIVRWSGASSFIDNAANVSGGVLSVIGDSSVYWSGGSLFSGNNAAGNGGALFITNRSTVSWSAETSFVSNSGENGGALYINVGSSVFWAGESSFSNNNARTTGGAVFGFESSISWMAETFFNSNTADVYGGAIAIAVGSRAFWEAPTTFYNNSASSYAGGAVLLYDNCSIFWRATTFFMSNTAGAQGGALAALISSTVTMEGDTFFVNNVATVDGGAAYIYHSDYQGQSLLNISNKALFAHNRCRANGGGIALIGSVFAVLSTANMTFSGNIAGIAGGAVYVSGAVFGPKFVGTRFISNSAEMGGGVYTTGSGIALVPNILGVPEPQNPFTFVACQFIGNEASTRGGALDSGAGIDLIVDTLFVGNTAGSGGALRLAGEASLNGCDFIENSSGEDNGPAVYDEGVVSNMSNSRFIDNIFNCAPNRYFAYDELDVLYGTVCKDCDASCEKCDFEGKEPMCVDAIDHSISPGGNTTVDLLLIEHGYWRASKTSTIILACYNPDACQGGVTGTQDYCLEGYEGPYCSVCSDKYTPSLGSSCNKCSDATGHWTALVVVLVVVIFVGFSAFLAYMLSGQEQHADRGIVARLSRFIPLHSLKIVIVVLQILTQFCDVANFVFPSIYQRFLDGVELLNFDFSWVISTRCIVDIDFHDRLLISTLGPIIGMAILGVIFAVAIYRHRDSEVACQVVRRKHFSMVLLLTFLVYSSVSTTVFTMFVCDGLDDGTSYLRADYRIDCDSSKHDALEIYAGVMLVLYAIGIPAFYATLLFSNHGTLTKDRDRENDDSVTSFGDLWKPYKPRCFFYEVVECCRRVLLTGVVVFVFPDSAAQIAVAFIMATAFLVISEALSPYVSPWDTLVNRMGHVIVVTSLFLALLLKVDVSKEETGAQKAFEAVLVAMHVAMVLVVIVEAGAMIMVWRTENVSDDPAPRSTRRISVPVGPLPGWMGSDAVEDESI